jgi:hypothetical protein
MRVTILAAAVLVGALAGSTGAMAAPTGMQAGSHAVAQKPVKPPPTHAVRGIVRSVDATSLVIARSAKKPSDLAFVLNPSTSRAGTIAAGATVSVRYRTEGKILVATAVTVMR